MFVDESAARAWQVDFLGKLAGRADRGKEETSIGEQARSAAAEIEDGYGATGEVNGQTHWVSQCDTTGCPWPEGSCVEARAALAGIGDARLLL